MLIGESPWEQSVQRGWIYDLTPSYRPRSPTGWIATLRRGYNSSLGNGQPQVPTVPVLASPLPGEQGWVAPHSQHRGERIHDGATSRLRADVPAERSTEVHRVPR